MPNWCYNSVTITGDTDKVTSLGNRLKIISKDDEMKTGMFKSLIGISENVSVQEYNDGGWYNANIDNWGTKWDVDVDEHMCTIQSDCIVLNFESAWSPPVAAFKKIAQRYGVLVEMYYEEAGSDFCGKTFIDEEGDSSEDDYEYQEGIYRFEGFNEWYEREFESQKEYLIDTLGESESTPEEIVEEWFGFLTEEEIKECADDLKSEMNQQD